MPIIASSVPSVAQPLAVGNNDLHMIVLIAGIVVIAVAVLTTCFIVAKVIRCRQDHETRVGGVPDSAAADIVAQKTADADNEGTLKNRLEIVVVPSIGSDDASSTVSRESAPKPATDLLVCRPERFVGVVHVLEAISAHELFLEAWISEDGEDSDTDERPVADTELSTPDGDPSDRLVLPSGPAVSDEAAASLPTPTIEDSPLIAPWPTPTPEPESLVSAFKAPDYDDEEPDAINEVPLDTLTTTNEPNFQIYYLNIERIPELKDLPTPHPHQTIIEQTLPPAQQGSPKSDPSLPMLPSPTHPIPSLHHRPPLARPHRTPFGLRQPPTTKVASGPRSSCSGHIASTPFRPLSATSTSLSTPATTRPSNLTPSTLRRSPAIKPDALPTPSLTPSRPITSSRISAGPSLRRTSALKAKKATKRTMTSTINSSISPTTPRAVKRAPEPTSAHFTAALKATSTVTPYPTPPTAPRTFGCTSAPSSSLARAKRTTPGWRR